MGVRGALSESGFLNETGHRKACSAVARSALGAGVALHGSQACQLSTRCMGEVQLSEDGDDGDVKSLSEGVGLIDKLGSFRPPGR